MKAMILAAGKGERMRPLTNHLPKPLLPVAGVPLIVYHLQKLAQLGVTEVIINTAYLGEKIEQALGDGSHWGLSIVYSREYEPLETGGALFKALELLGSEPFLLINGDVWSDCDFSLLAEHALGQSLGHLILVDNPSHNPSGDFVLDNIGRVAIKPVSEVGNSPQAYTFSGMALFDPRIIIDYPNKREAFALREVFDYWIERSALTASVHSGLWCDVGTPERLQTLDKSLLHAK